MIYQNLISMEILEFLVVFEIYMTHNEVKDEDLQIKYLVYIISWLTKIILKKLWFERLLIKKLW
jgi:hypothetical protein